MAELVEESKQKKSGDAGTNSSSFTCRPSSTFSLCPTVQTAATGMCTGDIAHIVPSATSQMNICDAITDNAGTSHFAVAMSRS